MAEEGAPSRAGGSGESALVLWRYRSQGKFPHSLSLKNPPAQSGHFLQNGGIEGGAGWEVAQNDAPTWVWGGEGGPWFSWGSGDPLGRAPGPQTLSVSAWLKRALEPGFFLSPAYPHVPGQSLLGLAPPPLVEGKKNQESRSTSAISCMGKRGALGGAGRRRRRPPALELWRWSRSQAPLPSACLLVF